VNQNSSPVKGVTVNFCMDAPWVKSDLDFTHAALLFYIETDEK
jgi:hypothetical protein